MNPKELMAMIEGAKAAKKVAAIKRMAAKVCGSRNGDKPTVHGTSVASEGGSGMKCALRRAENAALVAHEKSAHALSVVTERMREVVELSSRVVELESKVRHLENRMGLVMTRTGVE